MRWFIRTPNGYTQILCLFPSELIELNAKLVEVKPSDLFV